MVSTVLSSTLAFKLWAGRAGSALVRNCVETSLGSMAKIDLPRRSLASSQYLLISKFMISSVR